MRKYLLGGLLAASLVATPMMVGCDRELNSSEKTTRSPNGETTTTEQKTVQHPDGSVTTEKQSNHNNPGPQNP